jgi:hypothetical protein
MPAHPGIRPPDNVFQADIGVTTCVEGSPLVMRINTVENRPFDLFYRNFS